MVCRPKRVPGSNAYFVSLLELTHRPFVLELTHRPLLPMPLSEGFPICDRRNEVSLNGRERFHHSEFVVTLASACFSFIFFSSLDYFRAHASPSVSGRSKHKTGKRS
jgi:hypothetical protein